MVIETVYETVRVFQTNNNKKMYVDDSNVQTTTHKEEAVNRSNPYENDRQLMRVALESRMDPCNGSSHPWGRMFDEHIKWSTTGVHQLPVVGNSANKVQLNPLICEQVLIEEQYLQQMT